MLVVIYYSYYACLVKIIVMSITKSILRTGYKLVCRVGLHQYNNRFLLLNKAAFAVGATRIGLTYDRKTHLSTDCQDRSIVLQVCKSLFFAFTSCLSVKT